MSADWIGVAIVAGLSAPALMGAVTGLAIGAFNGSPVSPLTAMAMSVLFLVVGGIPSILVAFAGAKILASLSTALEEDMPLTGSVLGGLLGIVAFALVVPSIGENHLLVSVVAGFPTGAVSARIGLLAGQYRGGGRSEEETKTP